MAGPSSEEKFSPLDQIRQTEAEVTRSIAASRQATEQIVVNAKQQALDLKRQAWEDGIREGEARYRAVILSVEEESRAIVAEAHERTKELRRRGQHDMEKGVNHAVQIVIGTGEANEH